MATNKYRGEVALPALGKGVFIAFDLEDFAELEAEFGRQFFNVMEQACVDRALPDLTKILSIGLRKRDSKGVEKIGEDFDFRAAFQSGYDFADAAKPIMDAVSMAWLGKTHAELVEEATKAAEAERKKADAEGLKRAKEAAEEAGIPFDEALSSGLLKLLTHLASAQSQSGG